MKSPRTETVTLILQGQNWTSADKMAIPPKQNGCMTCVDFVTCYVFWHHFVSSFTCEFIFVSSCLLVILVWYGNKKTQNVLPQQVLGFIWIRRPSKSWHTMSGSGRIWNWAEGWMLLEILLSTTARTLYASRSPFWALRYFVFLF